MRESISTVMAMPAQRRILALGDMLELGDYSHEAHRSLGHYIGQCKPDLVYLLGEFSPEVRDGALENGLSSECIRCCANTDEIAASLKSVLRSGDLVLIKGSRVMRMERVVHLLFEDI
jgi:UDP-N-acetylmuramoyl-tripeptide--D-alanyl-D-alanine ligase